MTQTTTTIVSTITTGSSTTITFASTTQTVTQTFTQTGPGGVAINFFRIKVVNWQGNPFPNISVVIQSFPNNDIFNGYTNTEGLAQFQVPNGLYNIWATVNENVVLHATAYSSGDPKNLVTLQYAWDSVAVNFLMWSPIWIIPICLWLTLVACIIIVVAYLIFKSH